MNTISSTNKKIRVGVFTYDFVPWEGGMGRHVMELAAGLSPRSDMEFVIFSPCRNKISNHVTLFNFTKKFGKNVLFSFLLNLILPFLEKKYRLDIVHMHGGSGGLFFFRKVGKKLIATAHTNNYLRQYRQLKKITKLILYPLEKHSYRIADTVICVSTYIKNNLRTDYAIPGHKIHVVPNGVNTGVFHQFPGNKINVKKILFVGRIDRNKGLEFLLEALETLSMSGRNLSLAIAGEGQYLTVVKEFLKGKKIKDNVHFMGRLNDAELVKLYNQASLYVMPSIMEGFGLTILEAMACGCPVIATDSGGALDVIHDGHNGYLIKHGETRQLVDAISTILDNPDTRRRFVLNSLNAVKTKFKWEHAVTEHLIIYKQ